MSHSGRFTKRLAGKLDYIFDWTYWLEAGETIASYVLTVETGITKVSDALVDSNRQVVVWLSGGTLGERYTIDCVITTQGGSGVRIDPRRMEIEIGPF